MLLFTRDLQRLICRLIIHGGINGTLWHVSGMHTYDRIGVNYIYSPGRVEQCKITHPVSADQFEFQANPAHLTSKKYPLLKMADHQCPSTVVKTSTPGTPIIKKAPAPANPLENVPAENVRSYLTQPSPQT